MNIQLSPMHNSYLRNLNVWLLLQDMGEGRKLTIKIDRKHAIKEANRLRKGYRGRARYNINFSRPINTG